VAEVDHSSSEAVPGSAQMHAHVERVLQSAPFERSPRMQRFLRFLCEEMLAGRSDRLKEYSVAVAVFDKPQDFDPGTSAVIRVEAGRLRRLLARYQAEYGRDDHLMLSVPKGSYCPVFEQRTPRDLPHQLPSGLETDGHRELLHPELVTAGERRWVTVVSCGFGDELSTENGIDGDFLSAYDRSHGLCTSIARSHGGTLEAGASDRVIIYFGWPDAFEDSAGRAMTAALDIVAALRGSLERYGGVRIGIATSEVVARSSTGKPLIVGQAPALATKMLAQAPRDCILVSENTRRLSRTAFEMIPAGSIETSQGGSSLLWRLLRPRATKTRFQASRSGFRPGLVGRREEMALLLSRWQLALEGEGQAVVVEGEAGIGKSSLSEAVLASIGPKGSRVRTQCSPHHTNSALYPCVELVRVLIGGTEPTPAAESRIADLLARVELDGPINRGLLGSLLFQCDVGPVSALPGSQKKELTLQLLLSMLAAQTGRRPTVLLIEDIHWADPTTIELIQKITAMSVECRLFVIMTGRPGSSAPLMQHTNVTLLRLARLPTSDCNVMIDRLPSAASLSASARGSIVAKAEGIPLFIEELTKLFLTLDERPANSALVPETLSDLLASQLGRMGPARRIAQVAAVVGRAFSCEILKAVTGDAGPGVEAALDQLLAAGILTRSRLGADGQFWFRHALLRDAAYASILDVDRRDLHYRVGVALLDAGFSSDHPEIIARHMTDGRRHDEAIPFWVDAGRKAAGRYELSEAIADFRHALEALSKVPDQEGRRERELEMLLELGLTIRNAHGYFDPGLKSIYERAWQLADELRRPDAVASAIYGLWTHAAGCGHWPIARELAREFQQLSGSIEDDDRQLEIEASRLLGAGAAFGGEFALARLHFERAISLYDIDRHGPRFGYDPGAVSAAYLSWISWHLGAEGEARRYARQALVLAEAKGHPSTLAMVLAWLIFHAICERDGEAVRRYNDRIQTLCTEKDCRYWQHFGAACMEWVAFQSDGEPQHLDRLLDRTKKFPEHYLTSCLLLLGADLCVRMQRPQYGLEIVDEAWRFIEEHKERIWEAECDRLKAQLFLMLPRADHGKASHYARRALRIARQQEALPLQRRAAALVEELSTPGDVQVQPIEAREAPASLR